MDSPLRIVGEVKKDSPTKLKPIVAGLVAIAELTNSEPLSWSHVWLCVQNGVLSAHDDGVSEPPSVTLSLAGVRVTRAFVEDWPLAFQVDRNHSGLVLRFESPDEFNQWAKTISLEVLRFTKLEEVKSLEIMGESDRNAAVKQYMKQRENWENSVKEYELEIGGKLNLGDDKTKEEVDFYGDESCEFESFSFEELEQNRKLYFENPKARLTDCCTKSRRLPTIIEKADMVNELKEVFSSDPSLSTILTKSSLPVKKLNLEPVPRESVSREAGPSKKDVRVLEQEYNITYEEKCDDRVKAWNGPYILQKDEKEVLENINNVFLTKRKCVREEWILQAIKQVVAEHEEKIWKLQEKLAEIDEERCRTDDKKSVSNDYEALEKELQEEESYLQEAQAAEKVQERLVQDLSIRFEMALSKGLQDYID